MKPMGRSGKRKIRLAPPVGEVATHRRGAIIGPLGPSVASVQKTRIGNNPIISSDGHFAQSKMQASCDTPCFGIVAALFKSVQFGFLQYRL
jgi:hypothetical protein